MTAMFWTMAMILGTWTGLIAVTVGCGALVRRGFGLRPQGVEDWLDDYWVGFVLIIIILQLWHLAWPITGWAFVLVAVIGALGLTLNRKELFCAMTSALHHSRGALLLVALFAIWTSNRAVGAIGRYDTGLYDMAFVKWATTYPIVRGLGNLHGRLAFNGTFTLYAAMLDIGPWNGKCHLLANGALFVAVFSMIVNSILKVQKSHKKRYYHVFNAILIVPLLAELFGRDTSSISPDFLVFLLGLVIPARIVGTLSRTERRTDVDCYRLFILWIISLWAITVKISLFVLAMLTISVMLGHLWMERKSWERGAIPKIAVWCMAFGVPMMSVWAIRGILLSGYFMYPSALLEIPVAWQVPRALVLNEAYYIRSWGRQSQAHWCEVLGSWNWLRVWLTKLPSLVTKLLNVQFTLLLAWLVSPRPCSTARRSDRLLQWGVLIATLSSLAFWFFMAPNWNLAGSVLWGFTLSFLVLTIKRYFDHIEPRMMGLICYIFIFILIIYFSPITKPVITALSPSADGHELVPTVEIEQQTTASGLVVGVPTVGNQCWNEPLPCAPECHRNLRLLRPGDLSGGFAHDLFPAQAPQGVEAPADLLVTLVGEGWQKADTDDSVLVSTGSCILLLYTEDPRDVTLEFEPLEIELDGKEQNKKMITIINKDIEEKVDLFVHRTTSIELSLERDYNVIRLATHKKATVRYGTIRVH